MNRERWSSLFFIEVNSIFNEGRDYADIKLACKKTYPALHKLAHLTSLEMLILTNLILHLEDNLIGENDAEDFESLADLFESKRCNKIRINQALRVLQFRKLISVFINNEGTISFKANKSLLIKKKLYIPNWDLEYLGLEKICKN